MIYIEENSQKKQFQLIEFIANLEKFEIVFWLYPESKLKEFDKTKLSNDLDYKPITTYNDDFKPFATVPKLINKNIIKYLNKNSDKIKRNIDSIALYKAGIKDWYMCIIGHEGMCLVNNDILYEELNNNGFKCSLKAPSWW